jgi:hypothetical protein
MEWGFFKVGSSIGFSVAIELDALVMWSVVNVVDKEVFTAGRLDDGRFRPRSGRTARNGMI